MGFRSGNVLSSKDFVERFNLGSIFLQLFMFQCTCMSNNICCFCKYIQQKNIQIISGKKSFHFNEIKDIIASPVCSAKTHISNKSLLNNFGSIVKMTDSDSDYNVDEFIKPDTIRKPINDESADLLGNFDDVKRKEILDGTYEDKMDSDNEQFSPMEEESSSDNDEETDGEHNDKEMNGDEENNSNAEDEAIANTQKAGYVNPFGKKSLTKEQLGQLLKGAAKTNRFVLYVTNLNFETTKSDLEEHFSEAGSVRSIRIPKKRNGGFAFVEMNDLESFHKGFELHNTELKGRWIKVQISEAGKKKSANKKNIMKQKNRKLAEMRNENKTFTKSGKFYDKDLKKEKASKLMASKKWRKKPSGGGPPRPK
ncbi:uncharacterized protein LOC142238881 [Haematobia irritans]|uniref:uncharacterized protein LOC142238881 n=1 Tax=Haematobia irritans TaxID=7368 RepID=UPI003F4F5229